MTTETNSDHQATYSPEDNKIRIYPAFYLEKEDYNRLKKAGFKYAPKQELFVAPMWTPQREDIALEFCGSIGDEDTSLVDRALIRADRFEGYKEKRANEAEATYNYVQDIADGIPLGQPILVGHHSEKKARKHANQIENGMKKAVSLFETSKYWEYRAKGVLRHTKYKERPDVRARRIKKLEAEKRKFEKNKKEAVKWLNFWFYPVVFSRTRTLFALRYANLGPGVYYDFQDGKINYKEVRNIDVPRRVKTIQWAERWINHTNNRLTYEKTLLEEQGASDLLKPKKRPKLPPLCNYKAPEGIELECMYNKGSLTVYPQVEMTKAEYKKLYSDYKGTRLVENSHRVRTAVLHKGSCKVDRVCVFLTDSKVHKKPAPVEVEEKTPEIPFVKDSAYVQPERTKFDDLKDNLNGEAVKTVVAPQLFPTPEKIAAKMVELAEIQPGETVLEPSAGSGNLVQAVVDSVDTEVLAYEINQGLCSQLSNKFQPFKCCVKQADFLEITDFMGHYPKIIMNPPFENAADIKHIKHAVKFLAPGGRLVALCANGPRQNRELKTLAEGSGGFWEVLPDGSFKNSGTMVNAALLVIEN